MGLFKNVLIAFKPENLRRGLDAARNPPSQAEIEAGLAQLTPEQRAAYDANMARVAQAQAESQRSWQEAKAISDAARVLEGPAGRYLYGVGMGEIGSPDEINAAIAQKGVFAVVEEMRAKQKGEFKTALRQTFNIPEVEPEKDPAKRARVAADERAARDAARAPYNAPQPHEIAFSRIATRGGTQLDELIAYLSASGLAARPDHVFGVYRVPDRISGPLTPHSEKGRVVEWEVVHKPLAGGVSTVPCTATSFAADDRWVARRVRDPSILDEDLAIEFCSRAGIGPELCLGIARVSEFRTLRWGAEDEYMRTIVKGVVAIHPEEPGGAYHQMAADAPLAPRDPAEHGVHVEVLNWEEIGRAVHPKVHHPPPAPSQFPYLPSTPQELLRSYLEVVGVAPADCYSAQATVDRPQQIVQGGFLTTNLGPRQPCADGEDRMRSHACEQVVVAYRDRPEYAAGRERWAGYQRDVLQAHLERGMRLRPPVTVDDLSDVPRVLRPAVRVAEAIDRIELIGAESLPPYRYCWPPLETQLTT